MAKVGFIGTGGTISMLHRDPLELLNYASEMRMLSSAELVSRLPPIDGVEVVCVPFELVPSTKIGFAAWKELTALCGRLAREHPDLQGVVIGHGTATLEETAWFLNLVLEIPQPVVLVGAQRPASAFGSEAGLNLLNAIRTAACPASRGRGVLVMLNDEIHAARDVTKGSTYRLNAFRSGDFGMLGHVDGPHVAYYRRPERRSAPDTEFAMANLTEFPRVDIAYAHADGDGAAIDAFVAAGARGIVSAGFAPGAPTYGQVDAVRAAVARGVHVVQSTRSGSGIVHDTDALRHFGMIAAGDLNPQKARILLGLALSITDDPVEIRRIFATY